MLTAYNRAWIQQELGRPIASGNATPLSSAFYRLSRLLKHPIVPVFVFDSVSQATQKRGRQGQAASQQLAASFQHMVHAFGFNVHQVRVSQQFLFLDRLLIGLTCSTCRHLLALRRSLRRYAATTWSTSSSQIVYLRSCLAQHIWYVICKIVGPCLLVC